MADLSREDQYLLEEYRQAAQLTYHIDNLRNSLTGFFLTFVGVAGAGFALMVKGEVAKGMRYFSEEVTALLLLVVAILGGIVVVILARLRASQLEHFRIINNIRAHFLAQDLALWNVVELSGQTVPRPSRRSGTYFWTLLIVIVSSAVLAGATHLLVTESGIIRAWWGVTLVTLLALGAASWGLDRLYLRLAKPPARRRWQTVPNNP